MTELAKCLPAATPEAPYDQSLQIRQWVSDCLAHHEGCSPVQDSEYMPTRLIDVGTTSLAHVISIRSKHEVPPEQREYLALSYCWGKKPHPSHRTTAANFSQRCLRFPTSDLPRLFARLSPLRESSASAICGSIRSASYKMWNKTGGMRLRP